jgi:hypothetical protein
MWAQILGVLRIGIAFVSGAGALPIFTGVVNTQTIGASIVAVFTAFWSYFHIGGLVAAPPVVTVTG